MVDRFAVHDEPGVVEQTMHRQEQTVNMDRAGIDGLSSHDAGIDGAAWAALRRALPLELLHVLDRHLTRTQTSDFSGAVGPDSQNSLVQELIGP